MFNLNPSSTVYKVLLSSPIRISGTCEHKDFRIEMVHPNRMSLSSIQVNRFDRQGSETLLGRYHYMFVFPMKSKDEKSIIIPDYSHIGEHAAAALSVFFGKRFDNHGMIEGSSHFWMPHHEDLVSFFPPPHYPVYSAYPRKDINTVLDLEECVPIINFMMNTSDEKLFRFFFNAARFYLSSIRSVYSDLDKAYLDLITCGEILSNFYEYTEEELYGHDERLSKLLETLASLDVTESDLSYIKSRLYQVKRKFFLTLKNLLDDSFFKGTESKVKEASLTKENIDRSIKSAYDLRSRYVHTGFESKGWLDIYAGNENNLSEVQRPGLIPNTDDKSLQKLIKGAPTYAGLERIIRFALIKFLHTNDAGLHCQLAS